MSNIYIRFTVSVYIWNHVVELLSIRIVSEVIIDNSRGSSECPSRSRQSPGRSIGRVQLEPRWIENARKWLHWYIILFDNTVYILFHNSNSWWFSEKSLCKIRGKWEGFYTKKNEIIANCHDSFEMNRAFTAGALPGSTVAQSSSSGALLASSEALPAFTGSLPAFTGALPALIGVLPLFYRQNPRFMPVELRWFLSVTLVVPGRAKDEAGKTILPGSPGVECWMFRDHITSICWFGVKAGFMSFIRKCKYLYYSWIKLATFNNYFR
jgi:hypothetical protein